MRRRLTILILPAVIGMACGGLLRLQAPRSGERAVPAEAVVASSNPYRESVSRVKRPAVAEITVAHGTELRLLLVRYLDGANFEDVAALLSSPWASSDEFKRSSFLVYLRAAELDARGFLEWGLESLSGGRRIAFLGEIKEAWSKVDPEAAYRETAGEADWIRRQAMKALVRVDPDRAIEILEEEMPGSPFLEAIESQRLIDMSATDRKGALDEALLLESSGGGAQALKSILAAWAKTDQQAAWDWLDGKDEMAARDEVARSIIEVIAETNIASAREKLATLPNGVETGRLGATIVLEQFKNDPDGALQSVLGEEDVELRNYLFAKLSPQLSAAEPLKYLEMMRKHGLVAGRENIDSYSMSSPSGGMQMEGRADASEFLLGATSELAKEDPGRAIAYLQLLGGDERQSGTEEIGRAWTARDPDAAAEWAFGFSEGSNFGFELQYEVIKEWAGNSPEAAASFVSERKVVDEWGSTIIDSWIQSDMEAASAWVDSLAAGEEKTKLQERIQMERGGAGE